jgi:hypothetical protein
MRQSHVTNAGNLSERAIILAPRGRDAGIAAQLLSEAGFAAESAPDLPSLCGELSAGAGLAIIADEAVETTDLRPLDQRFLGSNHIRPRPQVCRTKYG